MENRTGIKHAASLTPDHAKDFSGDFSELAACVLPHLDSGRIQSCELVRWIKRRREKLVVELEAPDPHGNGNPPLRYIVKMHRRDGTRGSYEAMSRLWDAGFRLPSLYTIVRPVAYIADHGLLVQEKAPGKLLLDIILGRGEDAADAVGRAARWLGALHTSRVQTHPRQARLGSAVTRFGTELAQLLPTQASRIRRFADHALEELDSPDQSPLVPSHGDFHPKNVFITEAGRVTAIDFDTFGLQEAAADVAYFLAQTAIMGYFRRGSFAVTVQARDCFLQAYESAASPLPHLRLGLYVGMAFLQSLHYELCVFRNEKFAIIEPWLEIAERSVLSGELIPGSSGVAPMKHEPTEKPRLRRS